MPSRNDSRPLTRWAFLFSSWGAPLNPAARAVGGYKSPGAFFSHARLSHGFFWSAIGQKNKSLYEREGV